MSKIITLKNLFLISSLLICIFCGNEVMNIDLNEAKRGSLKDNEYDFYKLTLPDEVDKDSQIVFELEPNLDLDYLNNIISDPNLYISINDQYTTQQKNMWSSNRFGDETITISGGYINPNQVFYMSVYCKKKCNYILEISVVKNILLQENKINSYTLDEKSVMKFSFKTRKTFKELTVNVVGSFLNSFNAYLSTSDASSASTLQSEPILFNGYKFTLKGSESKNTDAQFNLAIDNNNEKQELNIWLKYDDDIMKIKEAELVYDTISRDKANCYYYSIDKSNQNKDIVLSTTLFNGQGFIYLPGFTSIEPSKIGLDYKTKDNSYTIIQNKAIRLTSDNFKKFGNYNENKETLLNFCFYAEQSSSLSIKMHFLENFKYIQNLNHIYPGIRIEDILPKKSLTKYKMEHFNIQNDLNIFLKQKSGKAKLYLYMANPERNNDLLDYDSFQPYKKADLILEAQDNYNGYHLFLTKELNKCKLNQYTKQYSCYLNAIVECDLEEDCTYELYFDHSKLDISMEPKRTYTNVISEKECDKYKITIFDPSVKNIAIVLTQNTGKTLLKLDFLGNENGIFEPKEEKIYDKSMPGVIKISKDTFNTINLIGNIYLKVEGLSYASYSIYYYTYTEEENDDTLDQEKVSKILETGTITKDIFIDNHRFKVYMYDSSKNGNKTDLFISLVEADSTNSEIYVFKDLNDFSVLGDRIYGYVWRGEYKDYIYIDRDDKVYKQSDILYIMIYKKEKTSGNDYTTFYLGITDQNTPLLLNEGIEFRQRFEYKYISQKFFYYYVNEETEEDLQISFSLYYGHINVKVKIDETIYTSENIIEDSHLILIHKFKIETICKNKYKCPINIEVSNDNSYLSFSSFMIAIKSSKNVPIHLKQGVVSKRSILSGEDQHFIVDLKPDKSFGAKISIYFEKGQGEIYARKLLKSELYNITNFPDENNYEYMASYRNRKKDFYIIEIPYDELANYNPCKILLTVRGDFPGYFSGTKIEYSISVSNSLTELETDKSYRLFISQSEIIHYHFRVGTNKKRLYISMTNKEQDANMFLNYETYLSSISEYHWKNIGSYNEYLDLSIDDPFFAEKQMPDIDGDYYLAIQGLKDCFFNLYISTQDVKIMSLAKGIPAGCNCETKNDFCYFRYESINRPSSKELSEQEIIFYTEYTYGSGSLFGKLYKNGNMEEIINSLPTSTNYDFLSDDEDYLYVRLNKENSKYTFSSVVVVGVQCQTKSLFDLNAAILDETADLTRNDRQFIFLKLDQDNIYYLSKSTGKANIFVYYMYNEEEFNFQIKGLVGSAEVHTYTNESLVYNKYLEKEDKELSYKNYHHISDFVIDSNSEEKKMNYGIVPKQYAKRNYFFININPIDFCLININIHYDIDMAFIPLNKEILTTISRYNYYAYFDILRDNEEVIFTLTSMEKEKNYKVYLKENIIKLEENADISNQTKYSKPNQNNYDIKGETNPLTSAVSLRVKNVEKKIRENAIIRVLVNIECFSYCYNNKLKIMVSPVLNKINRIRPQPHVYYFSDFEKKYADKTLYILRNVNKEDDLMVIEISLCKGNFIYALTDTPPGDTETYMQLQKRRIKSNIFKSNGKKVITVENLVAKEYYLTVLGANNGLMNLDESNKKEEGGSQVDILFIYYTTNKKNYNYLVTQDFLNYESKDDYYSLKIQLPELKKRDILGRENYVDYMNYTFIVSEKKEDFEYMESTCYLTKLMQKEEKNKEYSYLKTSYDKETKIFNIKGFKGNKKYYINILGKNEHTGEIITYNPVMIVTSTLVWKMKTFIIVFLCIIFVIFIFAVFYIYRKYRIEKAQLDIFESNKSGEGFDKKMKDLKNINLNVVKKKYKSLKEEKNND